MLRGRSTARRIAVLAGALSLVFLCAAHVGSPDAFFDGKAGAYPVRVIIRSPVVIPARAEIVIRVTGAGVRSVTATARSWNADSLNAPPPDEAVRVAGDSTLWTLQLWMMRQGSYAVLVHVDGALGGGTAIVPFTAVAQGVLKMNTTMAIVLSVVGIFLIAGMLTIIGAAAGESTIEPGAQAGADIAARARRGRRIAAAIILAILVGGRIWWVVEDRAYAAQVFRPASATVTVLDDTSARGGRIAKKPGRVEPHTRILRFALIQGAVAAQRSWVPLIPDHGKLMHLFLVKKDGLGALAHLHPLAIDSLTFESALPFLPAGDYFVFADVVHENGFAETMVQSVTLPEPPAMAWKASDPDDAVFVGNGVRTPSRFDDGSTLSWDGAGAPHAVGADAALRFTLRGANGAALTVEPYMGMAAHAVVVRDDGKVFVHLHPMGTTPSVGAMPAMSGEMPGVFEFPWAFPRAGKYRVWVQFRRAGAIRSAAFDVAVSEAQPAGKR